MEKSDCSIRSVPKSAFGLMQKLSKCVRHAEEKRREKKERPFGQSVTERNTLERRAEAKRKSFGHFERNTSESFSLRRCSPCEEIERNTMRV